MDSKVKSDNYFVVPGWAILELGLKGNDLLVYSIIYGFSQDDNYFCGSLKYLEDWTNSSRQGVLKNIKYLLDEGLIERLDKVSEFKTICYKANRVRCKKKKSETPTNIEGELSSPVNSVDPMGELSLPNSIDNNIECSSSTTEAENPDDLNKNLDIVTEVVNYINDLTGKDYKVNKEAKRVINERISEGFSLQQFIKVIEYKYRTWFLNPFIFERTGKLSTEYVRPYTLFNSNFRQYLEEADIYFKKLEENKKNKAQKVQATKPKNVEKVDFDNLVVLEEY